MQSLLENIQYVFDNPIKVIDWSQINDIFKKLLEKEMEYNEDEIDYMMNKLKFPESIEPLGFQIMATQHLFDHNATKMEKSSIPQFEKDNPKLVKCLNQILFKSGIASHLSDPIDYWSVMTQFEELLRKKIRYNTEEIKIWLEFYQKQTTREDGAIENIVQIAKFIQLYFELRQDKFQNHNHNK